MKTLIIDDEKNSRELIALLIEKYCLELKIIGSFDSVETGKKGILDLKPDLVMLDIEMPDGTGFDILSELQGKVDFQVIFITGYDHYAVKAFRFCALDYLLKPVSFVELKSAVQKALRNHSQGTLMKENLDSFVNQFSNQGALNKVSLPTSEGLIYIKPSDIVRCEASDNYTWVCLSNAQKYLISKTLKEYEEVLTDFNFFRIHHSHLINLNHIKKYHKGRGGVVEMDDNSFIEVAVRRRNDFLVKMGLHE